MERCGFFASVNGDRLYTDDEFSDYFGRFLQTGFFQTEAGDALFVQADGSNVLKVNAGSAWIQGRVYENTEVKNLTIEPGDPLLDRVDRVVVRCDYVNRDISVVIKKGTEASDAKPPELQRDSDAYELCLAEYKLEKGATHLIQAQVTDTRLNLDLCGEVVSLIDKHTLKQFCKVTGFTMEADIISKSIIPVDNNCDLGSKAQPFRKIYTKDIEISGSNPFLPITGGTLNGTLRMGGTNVVYTNNILPNDADKWSIGNSSKYYGSIYVRNINCTGNAPFLKTAGGIMTGGVEYSFTPGSNASMMRLLGFDGAVGTQGDGHTLIGHNKNGNMSHTFRGMGDFTVSNPNCNMTHVKAEALTINGNNIYIQKTEPANPVNGDIWIKNT